MSLRSELLALATLTIFAFLVTASPFAWQGTLYFDTLNVYSFFTDTLDSLHRFGEPVLWSPHINAGTPTYFYALLGQANLGRPAFVGIAAIVWVMGRLGIPLPAPLPLFVFYFAFLIPAIYVVGTWLVARRVLRTQASRWYVVLLSAFAPAVLLNLSDPGVIENTGYALILVAAFLRLVARPSRGSFAAFVASLMLLCVGLSQMVLAAGAPLAAAVVLAVLATSRAARASARTIPRRWWAIAAMLVAVALVPSLLAHRQQNRELVHTELGFLSYSYGTLKTGNPIQFLLASLPGASFEWSAYRQSETGPPSEYRFRSLGADDYAGADYLGLLATPLAALGLLVGRRRVRLPLFVALMITSAVLVMYGASPLFAPFLVLISPLRTLNHFGDFLFGGGAYLLVLFAAGLGFEAIERRRDLLRIMSVAFPLFSVVTWWALGRFVHPPAGLFGFTVMISVGQAIVLAWATRLPRRSRSHLLAAGLLPLAFLDVATVGFWYARGVVARAEPVDESSFGRTIGTTDTKTRRTAAFYMLRGTKELADTGFIFDRIPPRGTFCAALASEGPLTESQFVTAFVEAREIRRLPLSADLVTDPDFAPFFAAPESNRCAVEVRGSGTYNSVRLKVRAAQPALLFLRDGYSPQWSATVNGSPTRIVEAAGAFKAIRLPEGPSVVELRFTAPWVIPALLGSYALLLGVAAYAWRSRKV